MINFFWQPIPFIHPRSGQRCAMPNTLSPQKEVYLSVKRHRPHVDDFRCYLNGSMQPCSHANIEDAKHHCEAIWLTLYGNVVPRFKKAKPHA